MEFLFDPEIQTTPDVEVSLFGVTPMSLQDAYLLKLLANADRWADDPTFLRDIKYNIILESRAPDKIRKRKSLCRALSFYQDHVVVGLRQAARRLSDRETRARVVARLGLTPSAIAAIEAWRPCYPPFIEGDSPEWDFAPHVSNPRSDLPGGPPSHTKHTRDWLVTRMLYRPARSPERAPS